MPSLIVELANDSQRFALFNLLTPDPSNARIALSVADVINRFALSLETALTLPPTPDPSNARIARSVADVINRFAIPFAVFLTLPEPRK